MCLLYNGVMFQGGPEAARGMNNRARRDPTGNEIPNGMCIAYSCRPGGAEQ